MAIDRIVFPIVVLIGVKTFVFKWYVNAPLFVLELNDFYSIQWL